ncbi:MAG: hybrid sensor histidine kinase/response regulator [Mediterranea sp.]|jgi:two-component system sensor histidine kinase/response regulator|nr:hybrid sensor histidine kinase/response regulator [Mediterranea sp.]
MEIKTSDYCILIVDDVMSNVLLLKVLLTNEKFKIATASNGQQALDYMDKNPVDLVLLDVMMPGMDGFQVSEKMKANPATAEIPVIFLTALNSTSDIVKGFQAGASDFISKPFNKEELLIRVMHQISLIAATRLLAKQNDELKRTISGRDKLYSVIAHDLRSPIGSIKMVLNMLLLNLPADKIGEEMYELLTSANHTTEEVFALLDNLLKWTKSQIGNLNAVQQVIDVSEVVDGVVELFTFVSSLKKINIELQKTEGLLVFADVDMLKTVTRNLISNAIKYSDENTKIIISEKKEGNMAVVSVQDFGCGISEEGQKKLLHTDTHFSTFGTHNEEGSGLGLLLCKEFVARNDGKLWFESKEGVGSTFYFSVPLQKNE